MPIKSQIEYYKTIWNILFLIAKIAVECRGDHFAQILSSGRCENDVFLCVFVFFYVLYVLYVFSSKTMYFYHFEAPGMLKTGPACIFHYICMCFYILFILICFSAWTSCNTANKSLRHNNRKSLRQKIQKFNVSLKRL